MRAHDLMTRHVVSCSPETSVRAVAQLMRDEDCGCLPIIIGQSVHSLVGLVTARDLVCRALANDLDPDVTPVSHVMSSPVETIHENVSAEACVQRMADKQVRRLAVTDNHGRCCGIITQGEVARTLTPARTGDVVRAVSQPDQGQQPLRALSKASASGADEDLEQP